MNNPTAAELVKARTWLDEAAQRLGWSVVRSPAIEALKKEIDSDIARAEVRDRHRAALAKTIWDGPARTRTSIRSNWNELNESGRAAALNCTDQILDAVEKAGWTPPTTTKPAKPRTWTRLAAVPTSVSVTDKNGNRWRYSNGRWATSLLTYGLGSSEFTPDAYAPFTEVL